jgi:hypothetical protein
MDYGFVRALNDDFDQSTKKKDRVIETFDGYSFYLIIVDKVSKHLWIFLTKTKDPPIELTRVHMNARVEEK